MRIAVVAGGRTPERDVSIRGAQRESSDRGLSMTLRIASMMKRRASRACWKAARMMSSEIPLILMSI